MQEGVKEGKFLTDSDVERKVAMRGGINWGSTLGVFF